MLEKKRLKLFLIAIVLLVLGGLPESSIAGVIPSFTPTTITGDNNSGSAVVNRQFCGDHPTSGPRIWTASCASSWTGSFSAANWGSNCPTGWYNVSAATNVNCCQTCPGASDEKCGVGGKCFGTTCYANNRPTLSVIIGENINDQGNVLVRGYAFDPAVHVNDIQQRTQIKVKIDGVTKLDIPASSINKRTSAGAPCVKTTGGLAGECAFSLALDADDLPNGSHTIRVEAIDPDDPSTISYHSQYVEFMLQGCDPSKTYNGDPYDEMTIAAYTFNRPHLSQTWRGCLGQDRVLSKFPNSSSFLGFTTYTNAWPANWPLEGNFDDAINLSTKDHHQGGSDNAYTLGIYKYSGNQECIYVVQDYTADYYIIDDSYEDGFVPSDDSSKSYYRPNPLCANLTARGTTAGGINIFMTGNTLNINQGDTVTLNWTTSEAAQIRLTGPSGTSTESAVGSKVISGLAVGSYDYTLQSYLTTGADPVIADSSVTINVGAAVPETILPTLTVIPLSDNDGSLTTTDISASVGGTATGTINYTFWRDCNNVCTTVGECQTACGPETEKADNKVETSYKLTNQIYTTGTYYPKVVVERGTAPSAEDRETVIVTLDSCSTPPVPSIPSVSCNISGDQVNLSWNPVIGATSYQARLDYTENNISTCSDGWLCSVPPDNFWNNYVGTSINANITPNKPYSFWVHSSNACGNSVATSSGSFTCTPCSTEWIFVGCVNPCLPTDCVTKQETCIERDSCNASIQRNCQVVPNNCPDIYCNAGCSPPPAGSTTTGGQNWKEVAPN